MSLDELLRNHQNSIKTFHDLQHAEIVTKPDARYVVNHSDGVRINMNAGCKQLTLNSCKNINITAGRLPVMGIVIMRTDNTRIDIVGTPPKSGSGFMSLDHSVLGLLESDQECMVEINECNGILLNGTNISDQYHDSTWSIT